MNKKIILGIVIFIILIGGGVFLNKSYNVNCCHGEQYQFSNSSISDWKTYMNQKYQFSFNYPTTWSLENVDEGPIPTQKRVSFMFKTPGTLIGFTIIPLTKNEFKSYQRDNIKVGENNDYVFVVILPINYAVPNELKSEYNTLLSTFKFIK